MNVAQAFGENLKRLRAERDETQESLSAKSDLHRTVITQIEAGKSEAKASTILKLSGGWRLTPASCSPIWAGSRRPPKPVASSCRSSWAAPSRYCSR